mmetsp:Transcript_1173/g.1493  ORF Transcript_1173/g.1493 Transcript_1173/m.1493 type:complete len:108 (-) Transcript_1173:277-600(-)
MYGVKPSKTISVLGNGAFVKVNPYVSELPSERSKRSKDQQQEQNDSIMELMGIWSHSSDTDRDSLIVESMDGPETAERSCLAICAVVIPTTMVITTTMAVVYLVVLK